MANTYYSISPTIDTMLAMKTALQGKYGAGITVHFQDATNLVFTCSALSNKVQKITYASSRLMMYYGDSWTSGSTITNQLQWGGFNTGAVSFIDMVLGDYTLMICSFQTNLNGLLFIIGKLTNDDFAVFAAIGVSNATYTPPQIGRNTTDTVDFYPVGFSDGFASGSGKLFKQPLILQRSDGAVELNGDGTIASFRDIYNCSHALANNIDLIGSNYLMSSGGLYMGAALKRISTSIIAEF